MRDLPSNGVSSTGGTPSVAAISTDRWIGRAGRSLRANARKLNKVASWPAAARKLASEILSPSGSADIGFDRLGPGRHHAFLLVALAETGMVGCRPHDLPRARRWLPRNLFFARVTLLRADDGANTVLSDIPSGQAIHINPRYFSTETSARSLVAPYFAHPRFYAGGMAERARHMRHGERDVGITFAGTFPPASENEKLAFPILPRNQVLAQVAQRLGTRVSYEVQRPAGCEILFSITTDVVDRIEKHRLDLGAYVALLSRSRFALCPPGWRVPHSHNLVEAMSVGAIPITNYWHYMRPPLTPMKDCIGFTTPESLVEAVETALAMEPEQVDELRAGVLAYYDAFLDPAAFGRKLRHARGQIEEILVNDESGR